MMHGWGCWCEKGGAGFVLDSSGKFLVLMCTWTRVWGTPLAASPRTPAAEHTRPTCLRLVARCIYQRCLRLYLRMVQLRENRAAGTVARLSKPRGEGASGGVPPPADRASCIDAPAAQNGCLASGGVAPPSKQHAAALAKVRAWLRCYGPNSVVLVCVARLETLNQDCKETVSPLIIIPACRSIQGRHYICRAYVILQPACFPMCCSAKCLFLPVGMSRTAPLHPARYQTTLLWP